MGNLQFVQHNKFDIYVKRVVRTIETLQNQTRYGAIIEPHTNIHKIFLENRTDVGLQTENVENDRYEQARHDAQKRSGSAAVAEHCKY